MDISRAVDDLDPGYAFVTPAYALVRKFDQTYLGIRQGCDEPLIFSLNGVAGALAWLEKHNAHLWLPNDKRQIPMDMEETDYVIRIMLNLQIST